MPAQVTPFSTFFCFWPVYSIIGACNPNTMPKDNTILLIGGAAVALYLLSKKGTAAPGTTTPANVQLVYTISSVSVAFNGLLPILVVNISVSNPGSIAASIPSNIVGNLSSSGGAPGEPMCQVLPLQWWALVKRGGISVNFNLSLTGAVSDVINLITNQSGDSIPINLTGMVTANNYQQPVNMNYTIGF